MASFNQNRLRSNRRNTKSMECVCGAGETQKKKIIKLKRKYEHLRRHHGKLLAVTIELTQVLEEYVRGQRTPNVTETLVLCSKIYPSLFEELSARTKELVIMEKDSTKKRKLDGENSEVNSEIDKEKSVEHNPQDYVEGFWSKRELPRTPMNRNVVEQIVNVKNTSSTVH